MLIQSKFDAVAWLIAPMAWLWWLADAGRAQMQVSVDFDRQIVPILVSRCLECHNPQEKKGELDLTSSQTARLNPNVLGHGGVGSSILWQQVEQDVMPPTEPLPAHEKNLLRSWLEQNAVWGTMDPIDQLSITTDSRAGVDWWSLRPIVRPVIPNVRTVERFFNPVDAFIQQKLESRELALSPPADRATLLRRVYLDLLGLPPSPDQLSSFVNDPDKNAFSKIVDQLLDSPHYGERWGRHWLDVARYTESQGFEYDRFRPNAWHYRDYVIRSLNEDKPYDVFVKEQIAGDVAGFSAPDYKVTSESTIATSLLVCGPWDQAGSSQANVRQRMATREEEMEDLVSVFGQAFLGLTINCARCHSHKFDPISQEDYFRIKACFDGVKHGERSIESPEETKERQQRLASLTALRNEAWEARARIEKDTRDSILRGSNQTEIVRGPMPYARWTFEDQVQDSVGGLHGELVGGATVKNGRLVLNGMGQFAKAAPLRQEFLLKTLEAWVVIADREQRGGGVLSIETPKGENFDSIVYGERQPRKWISGSNNFTRTQDLDGGPEDAPAEMVIHLAIVYRQDQTIDLYRNGKRYGAGYKVGSLASFPADSSQVLIGLRHSGAGNGFLKAEIESASLYDRALNDQEVELSFLAGPNGGPVISQQELFTAMADNVKQRYIQAGQQVEQLNEQLGRISKPQVSYIGQRQQPPPTHRLIRGDVGKPAEVVSPAALSRLSIPSGDFKLGTESPESQRRLKLAEWLADPRHPLTPRVMVNRLWHYHFGRGLVETPNDFGFNGASPSHPELLDWLADEFVRGRAPWSLKHIHRLILNSATYQQSSAINPLAMQIDADNALLWRYSPRRLEGEIVRDLMLAVSGELNSAMGGPSFMPFKVTSFNSDFYQPIDPIGPEFNRRTIYRANINSGKSAMMDALDCPDPSIKVPARRVTTTPIAALALMNNSFVQRQANKLAERLMKSSTSGERIDFCYQLCFSRSPTTSERLEAQSFVEQYGLEALSWAMLNSSEFLYID